ncbi:MAG: efflux RND transporter periplasmic adaptor subunit [Proteobacteria bacterium]|nr:efflux RND transporter periplasmic adaptor subunit [Pseudomonadota bacterium]
MAAAIAFVLAAVIAGVYFLGSGDEGGQNAAGVAPSGPAPEVAVLKIQPERIVLNTELSGRVSASLVAEIRPQVSGLIQKRLYTEGGQVKSGEVLYQIDPAPFRAVYQQAQANLLAAQESVKRAQAALEASRARVEQQRSVLQLARTERERFEKLAGEGAISLRERDQAVTEAEVAEASFLSVQAQLKSDESAVSVAQASVKQAEAALETARINLSNTRITAPISGRIGKSNITVGALVTAYQPLALATILRMDPVFVDVSQSTADLLRLRSRIQSGQVSREGEDLDEVRLILEDGSSYEKPGTLKFQDVTVDPSTGSVTLRIVFPNPDGILLPGMFVRAVVVEGINEKAILIPQRAVSRDPKGNALALVVDGEEKVAQRMLILDRAIKDRWLVLDGLAAGDRVIMEGIQWVRPGAAVRTVPFQEEQPKPAAGNSPENQPGQ